MTLKKIVRHLSLTMVSGASLLTKEVKTGYVSDLLSDVIAHAQPDSLWVTLQTHVNIIAVAKLKDLAGIVIVNGRQPDEETKQKAQAEKIPLFLSKETAFQVSGKLYQLLNEGK
ncbi:MAG: serine kinase [Candidatus Aminicenantes bacterium 4484_214]|nr:MAG: serine kinase [Candidatus Aminicenantes bacterium 4484_214]